MRKILIAFFLLLALSVHSISREVALGIDSLLPLLSNEIENRNSYVEEQEKIIAIKKSDLKRLQPQNRQLRYEGYRHLFMLYKDLSYDSAFVYVNRMNELAHRMKNRRLIDDSRLGLLSLFVSGGVFALATDTLGVIQEMQLDSVDLPRYYSIAARFNYDMAGHVADQYYTPRYVDRGNFFQSKLLTMLSPSSDEYLLALAKNLAYQHRYDEGISVLEPLMMQWDLSRRQFPILASTLSFCYRSQGNEREAKRLLILAVISDIRNVKMESTTAMQLAELFYKERDLEMAHRCIQLAQDGANRFNARHRKVRISATLPLIETDRMMLQQQKQFWLRFYAVVISLLTLAIALFLYILYQQLIRIRRSRKAIQQANQKLEEINQKLRESNVIKNKYIVDFLDLCSTYIAKMEQQQNSVLKRVRERNYSELALSLNDESIEQERQRLFKRFDTIFLSLFPTFIDDFNALLNSEYSIFPKKNELLNTELRIYALMRLGINDPNSAAKFLNCSLNTIYAYKTRVNSKARCEDKREFERELMRIGFREEVVEPF